MREWGGPPPPFPPQAQGAQAPASSVAAAQQTLASLCINIRAGQPLIFKACSRAVRARASANTRVRDYSCVFVPFNGMACLCVCV